MAIIIIIHHECEGGIENAPQGSSNGGNKNLP